MEVGYMDYTEDESKIIEALKALSATSTEKLRSVEDISKKAVVPKNVAANVLLNLANKKVVKRVARDKAAGYCLLQAL
ncbi:MAG: transcriptional regulator [Candidatus Aenigmatarchaeota archaeon]